MNSRRVSTGTLTWCDKHQDYAGVIRIHNGVRDRVSWIGYHVIEAIERARR